MAEELLRAGVPEHCLLLDERSLNTRENLDAALSLLEASPTPSLAVVTCDWHLPRALGLLRRRGLTVRGLAAESPRKPLPRRVWRAARERMALLRDRLLERGAP